MDAIKQAILRIIIYCRVSTDPQDEQGYSPDTQIAECRKYAERLGLNVVAIFRESFTHPKRLAKTLNACHAGATGKPVTV